MSRPFSRASSSSRVTSGAMTHSAISADFSMTSGDIGSSSSGFIPREVALIARSYGPSALPARTRTSGNAARTREASEAAFDAVRLAIVSDPHPCLARAKEIAGRAVRAPATCRCHDRIVTRSPRMAQSLPSAAEYGSAATRPLPKATTAHRRRCNRETMTLGSDRRREVRARHLVPPTASHPRGSSATAYGTAFALDWRRPYKCSLADDRLPAASSRERWQRFPPP